MARTTAVVLCSRPDCALPRRHRDECENRDNDTDNGCPGCLPAQARDGLNLCNLHTDRISEDALTAAELHTALESQLRREGTGERTSGSKDPSVIPDEAVMDARHTIASTLAGLVELMQWERGLTPPKFNAATRATPLAKGEAGTAQRKATDVEVMGEFVARHHEWLAAHADAGKHALALHKAVRGDREEHRRSPFALAYPSRARDWQEIGTCPLPVWEVKAGKIVQADQPCGGRVVWYPEQSALAYCDGCDKAETIEWWRRELFGDPAALLDTVAAASWVSFTWVREVSANLIAVWSTRGKLPKATDDDGELLRDGKGRQLYRLEELRACAAKRFGEPPTLGVRRREAA